MPSLAHVRQKHARRIEAHYRPRGEGHRPHRRKAVEPITPPPPQALALFNTWRRAHVARDFWRAAEALQKLEELVNRHRPARPSL